MRFEKISFTEFRKFFSTESKDKHIKEMYDNLPLPRRMTEKSAGYDFYIPFNLMLKPDQEFIIPTGIKVYLDDDKKLSIYPRSGLGFKNYVRLANTVGIIDADYVDNEDNEGHILVKIRVEGHETLELEKYDRFCQGVIEKYYTVDEDKPFDKRQGGIGHTSKKE